MRCFINSQEGKIAGKGTEEQRIDYLKDMMRLILEAGEEDSVPCLVSKANIRYRETFGELPDYTLIKKQFNALLLGMETELEVKIRKAADPLREALLYARMGNYIDFGVFSQVEPERLLELLGQASADELEKGTYERLLQDLEKAGEVVYIHDNCGEVVLDKIVLKLLRERFPGVHVTSLIRQYPILNDVTKEDAAQVGLTQEATVMENGTDIAGTPLHCISHEAKALLGRADVILAKGQGNFETMYGCGLNVYYLFLCKCEWFQKRFGVAPNAGMFLRDEEAAALL